MVKKFGIIIISCLLIIFTFCMMIGCSIEVTNFDECVAAGNPVMESYPRQCRHGDQHFVEEIEDQIIVEKNNIDETNDNFDNNLDNDHIVGGDRDEHGCISSAGYTWCESKGECIRPWEESCEDDNLVDDIVTNFDECVEAGNPIMKSNPPQCRHGNKLFVKGADDPNYEGPFEEKTYCKEPRMNPEEVACTMEYDPVCGWFSSEVKCLAWPCAETYSNGCAACTNPDVEYYTKGECPRTPPPMPDEPIDEQSNNGGSTTELNSAEREGALIAEKYIVSKEEYINYNGRELTIEKVLVMRCPGCYQVEAYFYMDSMKDLTVTDKASVELQIREGEIIDSVISYGSVLTVNECEDIGGRVHNTLGTGGCDDHENNMGEVEGLLCPCVCCVEE